MSKLGEEYDAVLDRWYRQGNVIFGYIYQDKKGRFTDGTFVRTSLIKNICEDKNHLETLNTTYYLGNPQ